MSKLALNHLRQIHLGAINAPEQNRRESRAESAAQLRPRNNKKTQMEKNLPSREQTQLLNRIKDSKEKFSKESTIKV